MGVPDRGYFHQWMYVNETRVWEFKNLRIVIIFVRFDGSVYRLLI